MWALVDTVGPSSGPGPVRNGERSIILADVVDGPVLEALRANLDHNRGALLGDRWATHRHRRVPGWGRRWRINSANGPIRALEGSCPVPRATDR